MSRRAELADGLAQVRARIETACAIAGRPTDAVTLVVISKYFPASDVRILAELGVVDFGENRHPEALDKREACIDLDLRWHYVGGIQSNKASVVGSYVDVIQSVDRLKLVAGLDRGSSLAARASPLECFAQVSLDPPDQRGQRSGAEVGDLSALAAAIENTEHLRLVGLMAVAPLGADPSASFARLAEIRDRFTAEFSEALALSAGMSGDFEQAIIAGATHVRVGRSVLGLRPQFK